MKKYIAYYRVSTQKQNLGLDAQRNSVVNYITSCGGSLLNEYSEKESGKNNTRTELYNALAECKKVGATLIIAKLDRLSRNVSFIFALKDSGIDFVVVDLPELNTLTLGIFATIAQSERETISKRTKDALRAKKEQGYKLGNPNATFTEEMRSKAILVNKAKADTNENNKRAYAVISALKDKYSLRQIADHLNANNFRTSTGKQFAATSVNRLIIRYQTA